jgi:hypothetical protein
MVAGCQRSGDEQVADPPERIQIAAKPLQDG